MAFWEHLERLIRSVDEWNQWRLQNAYNLNPDLSGANLSEASLSEANLSGANLSEANLSRANLSRANLSGANLSEAILTKANLSEANLSRANLSEANLSKANLSEANLSKANLSEADLIGARLIGVRLVGAILRKAYLSKDILAIGANLSYNGDTHYNQDERSLKEQEYALRSSVDSLPKGKKLDKKAIDELKRYRLEIRQKYPGKPFEDSVDLLRQAREDRARELEQ